MKFYYINTDASNKQLGYSPHAKWIKYEYAFTSSFTSDKYKEYAVDTEGFKKYGVDILGKLKPGDILFMYANRKGVVSAGRVTDCWQGSSYKGSDRLVYQHTACFEYRIPVDWYLPIVNNPVRVEEFNKIRGKESISIGVLWSIDEDAGKQLLKTVQSRVSQC